MEKPQLKPHFRVEIVEPKHVYLLSEYGSHILTGQLYCQLIPLLDGNRRLDDIIQELQDKADVSQIDYALSRLQAKGYLVEAVSQLPHATAAFWSLLNIEPQIAYNSLQEIQVSLTSIGNIPTQPLILALQELGIETKKWEETSFPSPLLAEEGSRNIAHPLKQGGRENFPGDRGELDLLESDKNSLLIVLTDDYLQPELAKINQIALRLNQPWLLAKPVGGILWLGPIFVPGKTGCWQCLAQRLRGNREVEGLILRQKNQENYLEKSLPIPPALLPSTLATAINLITTEIAKWIVKQNSPHNSSFSTLEGKIITFDGGRLELETHILSQRPQCPTCGNPNLIRDRNSQPLILTSHPKNFTTDGGHRTFSPDRTLQRYQHLISPITGVVGPLVSVSDPDLNLIHNYQAIHSSGTPVNLASLRHSLRYQSGGKGKSDSQSKASCFGEAIERYSGIYQGDEARISSAFTELKEKAIHPRHYLHFSSNQYQNRQVLNQKSQIAQDWIPQPFDESKVIDWTPVWSLTAQTYKYLPTAWCYYGYPLSKDMCFCVADSNGNAAGNSLAEAILQGFFELVERDCVAIWWYNRLLRPAVDLASFAEPYLWELAEFYQSRNRELWVLDITSDLDIPTFAALSRRTDGGFEKIIAGYGAHFDPKIAILRAVTELNQIGFSFDGVGGSQAGEMPEWLMNVTIANLPYLAPNNRVPLKVYGDYPQRGSDDIYIDVKTCVEIAKNAGLETLVLDQTRPDIGLSVVKVIVPGLRHFWSRFAPGRLYDVPVKMGWLSEALTEGEMNPMPMPF